jgi:hypothetical protein
MMFNGPDAYPELSGYNFIWMPSEDEIHNGALSWRKKS